MADRKALKLHCLLMPYVLGLAAMRMRFVCSAVGATVKAFPRKSAVVIIAELSSRVVRCRLTSDARVPYRFIIGTPRSPPDCEAQSGKEEEGEGGGALTDKFHSDNIVTHVFVSNPATWYALLIAELYAQKGFHFYSPSAFGGFASRVYYSSKRRRREVLLSSILSCPR